ncbi:MAG: phosphoribosylanthranilate isomerase [Pseudomonadota bacterium]
MLKTRVKVCGITRPEDALDAATAGVDAIGLVFYPKSPRAVSVDSAKRILAVLPPFVTRVGLFVNAAEAEVRDVLAHVQLDVLQFHGDEDPQFCASFNRPWLKAIRVRPDMDLAATMHSYSSAQGILLDAWHETLLGGTGEAFDWSMVDRLDESLRIHLRLVLAGGLRPENVVQAIHKTKPWAVDVSTGVESAPGIKSTALTRQFIKAVQSA